MLNYVRNFLPEILSKEQVERVAEPMLMVDTDQVSDYVNYTSGDSTMVASYIYHAAGATGSFTNCRKVLDLGCGPATQLIFLAELNPATQFFGVDLSATMLTQAEKNIKDRQLKNITLLEDDISQLSKVGDESFDGVFSTVALHHLPSLRELESSFKNIRRILGSKKSLYITDFSLLKSWRTMDFLVNLNKNQPVFFKEDYTNSLRAAFPLKSYQDLKEKYLPWAQLNHTFLVPFMFVLKSQEVLMTDSSELLRNKMAQLSPENRRLFKDIYYFFRFGGVKNTIARRLF